MVRGLSFLLVFQLAGEVLARVAGWPIPGPVVGMGLLLLALQAWRPAEDGLPAVASALLPHLSLLFVPAGVGVMLHAERLAAEWPQLAVALVASTAATLAVTGLLAERLPRPAAAGEGERP